MHPASRNSLVRVFVVLGLTGILLLLGAILLPPKGGNAMPRGRDREPAVVSPR